MTYQTAIGFALVFAAISAAPASAEQFINNRFAFATPKGTEVVEDTPNEVYVRPPDGVSEIRLRDHGQTRGNECADLHFEFLKQDLHLSNFVPGVTQSKNRRVGATITTPFTFKDVRAAGRTLSFTTVCSGSRAASLITSTWAHQSATLDDLVLDSLQFQTGSSGTTSSGPANFESSLAARGIFAGITCPTGTPANPDFGCKSQAVGPEPRFAGALVGHWGARDGAWGYGMVLETDYVFGPSGDAVYRFAGMTWKGTWELRGDVLKMHWTVGTSREETCKVGISGQSLALNCGDGVVRLGRR